MTDEDRDEARASSLSMGRLDEAGLRLLAALGDKEAGDLLWNRAGRPSYGGPRTFHWAPGFSSLQAWLNDVVSAVIGQPFPMSRLADSRMRSARLLALMASSAEDMATPERAPTYTTRSLFAQPDPTNAGWLGSISKGAWDAVSLARDFHGHDATFQAELCHHVKARLLRGLRGNPGDEDRDEARASSSSHRGDGIFVSSAMGEFGPFDSVVIGTGTGLTGKTKLYGSLSQHGWSAAKNLVHVGDTTLATRLRASSGSITVSVVASDGSQPSPQYGVRDIRFFPDWVDASLGIRGTFVDVPWGTKYMVDSNGVWSVFESGTRLSAGWARFAWSTEEPVNPNPGDEDRDEARASATPADRLPNTRAALAVFDAGEPARDAAWNLATTDIEARMLQAADDAALNAVRRAFYEDTKEINDFDNCMLASLKWLRGLVKGTASNPGDEDRDEARASSHAPRPLSGDARVLFHRVLDEGMGKHGVPTLATAISAFNAPIWPTGLGTIGVWLQQRPDSRSKLEEELSELVRRHGGGTWLSDLLELPNWHTHWRPRSTNPSDEDRDEARASASQPRIEIIGYEQGAKKLRRAWRGFTDSVTINDLDMVVRTGMGEVTFRHDASTTSWNSQISGQARLVEFRFKAPPGGVLEFGGPGVVVEDMTRARGPGGWLLRRLDRDQSPNGFSCGVDAVRRASATGEWRDVTKWGPEWCPEGRSTWRGRTTPGGMGGGNWTSRTITFKLVNPSGNPGDEDRDEARASSGVPLRISDNARALFRRTSDAYDEPTLSSALRHFSMSGFLAGSPFWDDLSEELDALVESYGLDTPLAKIFGLTLSRRNPPTVDRRLMVAHDPRVRPTGPTRPARAGGRVTNPGDEDRDEARASTTSGATRMSVAEIKVASKTGDLWFEHVRTTRGKVIRNVVLVPEGCEIRPDEMSGEPDAEEAFVTMAQRLVSDDQAVAYLYVGLDKLAELRVLTRDEAKAIHPNLFRFLVQRRCIHCSETISPDAKGRWTVLPELTDGRWTSTIGLYCAPDGGPHWPLADDDPEFVVRAIDVAAVDVADGDGKSKVALVRMPAEYDPDKLYREEEVEFDPLIRRISLVFVVHQPDGDYAVFEKASHAKMAAARFRKSHRGPGPAIYRVVEEAVTAHIDDAIYLSADDS